MNLSQLPSSASLDLRRKAWKFAALKHRQQLYPGTAKLPYIVHIGAVLLELFPALYEKEHLDADLAVCCALLHDTIEDTDTSIEEIEDIFGLDIAAGVSALTKDIRLKGLEATRESLDRIQRRPYEIWCVKLADRIANLGTPPDTWKREKCLSYAKEAEVILEVLGDASGYLSDRLRNRITVWQQF
jgi:(p)ppGpp synthase/HD superfamily hydrolase